MEFIIDVIRTPIYTGFPLWLPLWLQAALGIVVAFCLAAIRYQWFVDTAREEVKR